MVDIEKNTSKTSRFNTASRYIAWIRNRSSLVDRTTIGLYRPNKGAQDNPSQRRRPVEHSVKRERNVALARIRTVRGDHVELVTTLPLKRNMLLNEIDASGS